jgi:hypothetical protein
MSDEPLIVPEFDPDQELPLVLPWHYCLGVELDGKRCTNRINHAREYCFRHDPTPDQMLEIFSDRLHDFIKTCKACGGATAEEILVLSKAMTAFGALWDRKANNQPAEAKELIKHVRFTRVG